MSPEALAIKDEVELNGGSFLPPDYRESLLKTQDDSNNKEVKPRFIPPDDPNELISLSKDNQALNALGETLKKQCTISAIKQFVARTDEAEIQSLEKYITIQKKFLAKAIIESLIGPLEMLVLHPDDASKKIQLFIDSCKIKKPELIIELIKQCLPRENVSEQQRQPSPSQFSPIIINNIPQVQSEAKNFKDNIIDAA